MEKFELCYFLDNNHLLIPDLLEKLEPENIDFDESQALRFRIRYDFLPKSIMPRLIVKLHEDIQDDLRWRTGVVLQDKKNFDTTPVIKTDYREKLIYIIVNGSQKRDYFSFIRKNLNDIHNSFKKLKVTEIIPLPDNIEYEVKYKELIGYEKAGKDEYFAGELGKSYSVSELLNGIEKYNARRKIYEPAVQPEKVEKMKTNNEFVEKISNTTNKLYLLHLSDLHIKTQGEATIYLTQLKADLLQELKINQLEYLILSGDIGNYATTAEYQAAASFVESLIKQFSINREKIIIVPGNHDVSYELSKKEGYQFEHSLPTGLTENKYYKAGDEGYLIRQEDGYQQRFRNFNEAFYNPITKKNYPLNYNEQAILHIDQENKLLFLALNSAWEVDHYRKFENRASIHREALAEALDEVLKGDFQNWLKIAVWHHPVTGKETMNDEFLQQLVVNGFKICMHGHIHEAKDEAFKYDSNRGIRIIAAGTFGAPAKEQTTGIPLQYNLLTWNKTEACITVQTRKKEKPEGAWKADARWGNSNSPTASYKIELFE